MRGSLAALALAASFGCGSGSLTAPTAAVEVLALRLQTEHFRLMAGQASDATIRAAADQLEAHYARILADLGVARMEPVTVRIWQDETTYFDELFRYFGVRYPASGYITGRTELRVLAVPQLATNVVHEFAHAASMYVNPSIANNPRWFWETVALYENREVVDPRRVDSLVRGAFPTLQQLNADPNAGRQVYELGYHLGDFIVSHWGQSAFLRLIETNADLPGILGMSAAQFEAAWQAWLRDRYFS